MHKARDAIVSTEGRLYSYRQQRETHKFIHTVTRVDAVCVYGWK